MKRSGRAKPGDSGIHLWVGVRCRNPKCKHDFPASLSGSRVEAVLTREERQAKEPPPQTMLLADKFSRMVNIAGSLAGAGPAASERVDVVPLLQHCPFCERSYVYLAHDFYMTSEPLPRLPR